MSEVMQLAAEPRERVGKGPARAVRRTGRVPAIIYGAQKDPTMISLEGKALMMELGKTGFYTTLYDLALGSETERVLPRDVQFDPVTDQVIHADFMRVSATTEVTVDVPVVFLNEELSPGLVGGGVLNVVRHEIEMTCLADAIPRQIEIDLTGLEVGDGVHISMIKLPDGVAPTITDRDFTIATIAAPKLHVEEEEVEEGEEELEEGVEAAEGEEGAEAEGRGEAGEADED